MRSEKRLLDRFYKVALFGRVGCIMKNFYNTKAQYENINS